MSACSTKEESEWRTRLTAQAFVNYSATAGEQASTTMLSLSNIKPLGTVFGKPGTNQIVF
jgi:hypothetical protein